MPTAWQTAGCKYTPKISRHRAATVAALPATRGSQRCLCRPRYRKKLPAISASSTTTVTIMLVWILMPAADATPAASDTCARSQGRKGSPRSCRV